MVVAGWAASITAMVVFVFAAGAITKLASEWRPFAHVSLTFVYLLVESIGLSLAFGSASEGVGSAIASLLLAVPTQISIARSGRDSS